MMFYSGPFGIKIRKEFEQPYNEHSMTSGRWAGPGIGGEDKYEMAFLEKAVATAQNIFTMVELGCGYARWLVNGAKLCEQAGIKDVHLIGVEASRRRFEFALQHLADNQIDFLCDMYNMGVGAKHGIAAIADDMDYGSALHGVGNVTVEPLAYFLPDGPIDYLCMDIQGAEADVLESSIDVLPRCRFIHVATHSFDVAERCKKVMAALPFEHVGSVPKDIVVDGVRFIDGMEQWRRLAVK